MKIDAVGERNTMGWDQDLAEVIDVIHAAIDPNMVTIKAARAYIPKVVQVTEIFQVDSVIERIIKNQGLTMWMDR